MRHVSLYKKVLKSMRSFCKNTPRIGDIDRLLCIAYMNLGTVQASLGDHEGAKLSLQQSINIATQLVQENPAIIRYRERLAHAYLKLAFQDQSRLDEAIAVHQELLKHVPNHEQWAWQARLPPGMIAFWRQENHTAAADAFARGLAVQPKHLALLSNDAELALVQGDKDRFHARIADSVATGHNQGPSSLLSFAVLGMAGQPYPGLGQCHDGDQKVRTRRHLQVGIFRPPNPP